MNPEQVSSHRRRALVPLIVGVGSSGAGGFEAFRQLLAGLGDAPELSLIWVQHGDRQHAELPDCTPMKVVPIAAAQEFQGGTLYIAPPHALVAIEQGSIQLLDRDSGQRGDRPIDYLFRSIAQHQGEHGVAVLLSSAGGDGTLGLQAIRDRGGLTLAFEAASVVDDAMPHAATAAMEPREIAAELLRRVAAWPGFSREFSDSGSLEVDGCGADPVVMQVEKELERVRRELHGMRLELKRSVQELRTANEELRAVKDVAAASDHDARFTALLNSTAEGIYGLDLDGKCTFANAAAASLLGYAGPEDLLGQSMHDLVHHTKPDGSAYPAEACRIRHTYRQNARVHVDDELYWRPDGSSFEVEYWSYPMVREGQTVGSVVTFLDVTDRKQAERSAAEKQARLELALSAGRLGFWHWDIAADRVTWSSQLYDLLGFTSEQVEPTSGGFIDKIHPEDRKRVRRRLDAVFSGNCDEYEIEFRVIRGDDGRTIWTSGRGAIDRDQQGKPLKVTAVVSDITERKRWEIELADREAHLRRVINNQLGLVGVIDRHGLLVEVDDRSMGIAGLTREDVIGKHFADCEWWTYDQAVTEKLLDAMDRAFAGEVMRYDVGLYSMEGSPLMIDFMLTPVRDPQGDVEYLIFSGVDISDRHAAEKENQATSAKLRALFNNAFYYTGVLDLNGVLVDINDSALKPMGLSRQTTLGLPFWDTPWWQGQDESQAKLKANFDKALAGEMYREVLPFLRPDQSQGYSDFIYTPAKDEAGNVLFIVCNGSDVTERRQYEQRIAESRERLQMAMGAARMGAFEWDIQADRADWDEQWRELMGLPEDAPKTVETFFRLLHPDDLAASREALEGQGSRQERYEQEFRIVRPDGEIRWIAGRGNILLNDQGETQRMIGLNWDVTAEKENERRIVASEERLRLALRAAELKLWQWDVNGDRFYWSGELTEQSALDPLQSVGGLTKFLSTVHPDDRQRVQQTLQTSLAEGTPYRCEYRVRRSAESYRWVMSLAHLSVEGGEAPVQMIGVELDITQQREFEHSLKEAREQAVAANESKSLFLANMSHEIRTPMTAIMGYTDLVAGMVEQEEALSHLRTIRRNGDFLLEIINDILDLSKIEAGKFEIRYGRFAPHRLVEDVRSFMAVRAQEKNLCLDVEYEGAIPVAIESDPKGLKQILINLVGNAIKFTPRGSVKVVVRCVDIPCQESKLVVSTGPSELPPTPTAFLQFDIIDTGIGMSEQQLQRLFQPFSQGDGNVNRQFGGTGLGLAISKRLTEMLGGEISVRTQLGQGSTFTVTVATGNIEAVKKIHPGRPSESPLPDPPVPKPQLDCHALVVDDRRDIRFLSKVLLEKAGAQVSEAEDGEVAIAMVEDRIGKDKMFDLILLDMQMPRLDGYQTAEQLRGLGYVGPIIALTADAMQGDMTRCIQSGCDDYLSKPIDKNLLINMIQQHLHDRRR